MQQGSRFNEDQDSRRVKIQQGSSCIFSTFLSFSIFLNFSMKCSSGDCDGGNACCTSAAPCSAGQGDCDSDSECRPGFLTLDSPNFQSVRISNQASFVGQIIVLDPTLMLQMTAVKLHQVKS